MLGYIFWSCLTGGRVGCQLLEVATCEIPARSLPGLASMYITTNQSRRTGRLGLVDLRDNGFRKKGMTDVFRGV